MPKNVDPEHDPIVRDDLATLDLSAIEENLATSKQRHTHSERAGAVEEQEGVD